MAGFVIRSGDSRSHDGLDDAKGGGLITLDGGICDPVTFELTSEAPTQTGVSLGVRGVSGVKETIQEVGCYNIPPCLRNLLFPKLVQASL